MGCYLCGLCRYDELQDQEEVNKSRGEEEEEEGVFRATPRWKVLMRRVRRKLRGRPKLHHSFRYDAASYAMNFQERGLLHHSLSLHQF